MRLSLKTIIFTCRNIVFKSLFLKPLTFTTFSCLLFGLTIYVYYPVVHNDFINFDDPTYVTNNPHLSSGLNFDSIGWALTTSYASNWHPLTWLSHLIDIHFFGYDPSYHHAISLIIHAANAVLLFLWLKLLTDSIGRSFLVSLIFSLHPLRVESVAWVAERKDVLSLFFGLLSLIAYTVYARRFKINSPRTALFHSAYIYSVAFFVLGLLSKPMLVTLPILLILLDFWPLHRFPNVHSPDFRSRLIEKLPFFILAALSCCITYAVQSNGGAVQGEIAVSFPVRLANALVSLWRYLENFFNPTALCVFYPHPLRFKFSLVLACLAFLTSLFSLSFLERQRHPWLLVGTLWFLVTLLPVIGLIQVGTQSMADRYTYLPLIGPVLALVWGLHDLTSARPAWRFLFILGGVLFLVAMSRLTRRQIAYWENSETLFRQALRVTINNSIAHDNLGVYLGNLARNSNNPTLRREAIEEFRAAYAIEPRDPLTRLNLGLFLADGGEITEAVPHLEFACKYLPQNPDAPYFLGRALLQLNRHDEATGYLYSASKLRKFSAMDCNTLGALLRQRGHVPEAILQYEEALRQNPDYYDAHNNLGIALGLNGKIDESIFHFQEALRLCPQLAEAHNNLGQVYAMTGRNQEARRHFLEALRLNPSFEAARRNLAALPKATP